MKLHNRLYELQTLLWYISRPSHLLNLLIYSEISTFQIDLAVYQETSDCQCSLSKNESEHSERYLSNQIHAKVQYNVLGQKQEEDVRERSES